MSKKLQPVRGMKDVLSDEYKRLKYITDAANRVSSYYGFEPIDIPIMEYTEVFSRTLGEDSDVVNKEMYSFNDRGGDSLTLRPEFTAGIVRAIFSGGLQQNLPLRLFSHGPVFRYDRPQKGRYRQFSQINFEMLGQEGAFTDAEMIAMARQFLSEIGVLDKVTLELNSLGCEETRAAHRCALVEYFSKYKDSLSKDSLTRLEKNPLRILDSKEPNEQEIIAGAPKVSDYYTKESRSYFEELQSHLEDFDISYQINPAMVRGLDYYSHTTFEFTTDQLGAQGTVLAGGRYDKLAEIMSSKSMPAIGCAGGVERLRFLTDISPSSQPEIRIMPIEDSDSNSSYVTKTLKTLREAGIKTTLDSRGKLAKRMQRALQDEVKYLIFVGAEEVQHSQLQVKNLSSREETTVAFDKIIDFLRNDRG